MQTCSVESGRMLTELEVIVKSSFYWIDGRLFYEPIKDSRNIEEWFPAYTLDEILEQLPHFIKKDNKMFILRIEKIPVVNEDGFFYNIEYCNEDDYIKNFLLKNPAEAAAQMWIWLTEKGYAKI